MTNLPLPLYALVTQEEKRSTKDGRFFWQMSVKTEIGIIKAVMWNASSNVEDDPKFPHKGDVLEITGFEDQVAERGSIVIKGFYKIDKKELPDSAKSILEIDKASKKDLESAWSLIADSSFWNDKKHHDFMMTCLNSVDKVKLMESPAATNVHHAYNGGLIVHTAEVLSLCKGIVEVCDSKYGFMNADSLYCGAILHDIGKVETYRINEVGVAESVSNEKTIGHLFYGMYMVQSVFEKNDCGVSKRWIDEVLHLIASHHGLPEWGSVKVIQSVEAGILSRMDYISSRNGMVEKILKDSIKSGQPLQDNFQIYGDPYFRSIGMDDYVKDKR